MKKKAAEFEKKLRKNQFTLDDFSRTDGPNS